MNPDVVYAKTAQGVAEIGLRTGRLPSRLRSLLITVDGQTSAGRIIARSPLPDEVLAQLSLLLEQGFIEVKAIGRSEVATVAVPPVAADPLEVARKFMLNSMVGALGGDAERFTRRIESARSLADLSAFAQKYVELVRAGGGNGKAEAFRAGLRDHGIAFVAAVGSVKAMPIDAAEDIRRLANTKKAVIRFLHETFGSDADKRAAEIESARTIADLKRVAAQHLEMIRGSAGARRAEDFRATVIAALNS